MRFLVIRRALFALMILSLQSFSAFAEETFYNMPRGVTSISQDIYDLHMVIFYICVVIGILVYGVLIYSLIKYRKSKGATAAHFHENTAIEIIWTIIPFLILVVMAIPATKVLFYMQNYAKSDLTIKVTGYQWRWKYEYLDSGIGFFSNLTTSDDEVDGKTAKNKLFLREVDNPLVLPIGKKIRFLITSNDVIHSWWVPEIGVKKDAIPGFIQESWATINDVGTYRGQCSVLCGARHAFMPIVVKAVAQNDYDKWVQNQQQASGVAASAATKQDWTKEELLSLGKTSYDKNCSACHKPDGTGMPPAFPALKGSKIAIGPVKDHILLVLKGVPGTAMQAFANQLSDVDLAAIITYERNSWGNDKAGPNAGGIVKPADVKALRAK